MRSSSWLCSFGCALIFACSDGPAGPAGAEGAKGAAGERGPSGERGQEGQEGQEGREGREGREGPAGPLAMPPRVSEITPSWGSSKTRVTLLGDNFSSVASENRVLFNGHAATVITATTTELVIEPALDVERAEIMAVSVEVNRQVSNAMTFQVVPSGYPKLINLPLPSVPTAAVQVGNEVYLTNINTRDAGLYKRAADGSVTRVLSLDDLDGGELLDTPNAPIALATDGTDVFFITMFGSVNRYDVALGTVTEVVAPNFPDSGNFPPRTALAIDGSGVLYVVDGNLNQGEGGILVVRTDGTTSEITDPSFLNRGSDHGIFSIVADSTALFVTNESRNDVIRIDNPNGAVTVTSTYATGAMSPQGITVVGNSLVVSSEDGRLMSVNKSTGGALTTFGAAIGYGYLASSLHANAAGDLLLAQPDGGVVRRLPSGSVDAEIITAGVRVSFGAARINDRWYFASVGPALFGSSPMPVADGALLEVTDDGTSSVIANGGFLSGVADIGNGLIGVSDCTSSTIFSIDPASGARVDLLTSTDGLRCPAGLLLDQSGNLFYANAEVSGGAPGSVGRLTPGGEHAPDHISGLVPGSIHIALVGDTIIAGALGLGEDSGMLSSGDAINGGPASVLLTRAQAGRVTALGHSPTGTIYVARMGFGEILELDLANGTLSTFGSVLVGGLRGGNLGEGNISAPGAMAFLPDGTFLLADFWQQAVIAVAP